LRKDIMGVLSDNLYVLYATSEIGIISCAMPDQHERFPEGVGFPAAGVTLEIVGSDGTPVAPGEIGQIRLRKDGTPRGYVTEPGATSNFQEGWFYPRDLVSLRPGEPLIFHGRADDVMILNGINIFPSAIEDILESHPDVKEAVAYAIKSRVHGEIPAAAVVLKDTSARRDPAHLLDHCRQTLGIRAPRQIAVVDIIPRNSAGKPLRRALSAS
jgi:acyl-CoA synthetase (AMP-forming)/AMP-acid ligase II